MDGAKGKSLKGKGLKGDGLAAEDLSRDDIVGKLRELQGGVVEVASSKKGSLVQLGALGAVVLLILVFLLGRRAGRAKSSFVEIRRI